MPSTIPGNPRTVTSTSTPNLARSHDGLYDFGWLAQLPQSTATPQVLLFRRTVADNTIQTFDLSTMTNNPFNMPLQGDGHFTLTVISDASGRVHVVGNLHADPLDGPGTQRHYGYTTWPPTAASSWTFPAWSSLPFASIPEAVNAHTYFRWTRNTAGDLLAWQDQEDQTYHYHRFWTLMRLPAGSSTWEFPNPSAPKIISGDPSPTATPASGTPNRAYGHMVLVGDRVHVMFMFADVTEATSHWYRQGHSYIYSDPPYTTWKGADGTTMTLPVTYSTRTAAAVTSWGSRTSLNIVPIVGVDDNDRPSFVTDEVDSNGVLLNPPYHQHTWTGSAWTSTAVASPGASWPGVFWYKEAWWSITTGPSGGVTRGRIRPIAGGSPVLGVAGTVDANYVPVPDPVTQRDRTNPRFLITDGNTPAVYDVGLSARPHP